MKNFVDKEDPYELSYACMQCWYVFLAQKSLEEHFHRYVGYHTGHMEFQEYHTSKHLPYMVEHIDFSTNSISNPTQPAIWASICPCAYPYAGNLFNMPFRVEKGNLWLGTTWEPPLHLEKENTKIGYPNQRSHLGRDFVMLTGLLLSFSIYTLRSRG